MGSRHSPHRSTVNDAFQELASHASRNVRTSCIRVVYDALELTCGKALLYDVVGCKCARYSTLLPALYCERRAARCNLDNLYYGAVSGGL